MPELIYKGKSVSSTSNDAALIDYDNSSSGIIATNVQTAIDAIGTIYRKTLTTGETSISFTNNRINSNAVLNVFTSIFGASPSNITIDGTTATMTFDAQTSDMEVGLQILN